MRPRVFIIIVGFLVVAFGLIWGLIPVTAHSSVNQTSAACGSAFASDDMPLITRDFSGRVDPAFSAPQACSDSLSPRRTVAIIAVVIGALVVGGGAAVRTKRRASIRPVF